jgi:hypothetical protein
VAELAGATTNFHLIIGIPELLGNRFGGAPKKKLLIGYRRKRGELFWRKPQVIKVDGTF